MTISASVRIGNVFKLASAGFGKLLQQYAEGKTFIQVVFPSRAVEEELFRHAWFVEVVRAGDYPDGCFDSGLVSGYFVIAGSDFRLGVGGRR